MGHPTDPLPETTPNWNEGQARRTPIYLLGALLLALLAGFLTYRYLQELRAQSVATGQALVAVREIRPGSVIAADSVEPRDVPEAVLPAGAITELEPAVGRTAAYPLAAGEVILQRDVVTEGGGGLSARLPDGRWAMILPAGWLVSPLPPATSGDRLDLVAYQTGQAVEEAGVIVSAVELLDEPTDEAGGRLLLAVTMDEAVSILYSRSNGFQLLALLRPRGG